VGGVRGHLAGQQVAHDDAHRAAAVDDDVEHLGARVELHLARRDLARHRLVGAEQQLLAGLPACVERARDLRAAERAVVEQPAVLARDRHALRGRLVDDLVRDLREPVHVRLARAEVAALDRVVEEAEDAVAVVAVVLGGVDPALRRDAVCAPRRVVEGERLHLVAELGQRRRRGRAGEAGADDDDAEAPLVGRVDESHAEAMVVPRVLDRARRDHRLEVHPTTPVRTASGKETLPAAMTAAKPIASSRRRGRSQPRLWNRLQAPWYRWIASARFATT
jgi:hypothetical protein